MGGSRLTGSRRPGGRSAASSVTQAPAPGGPSAACSSHKCRLAPHASGRFDPTVAPDPGPSVKTRTGRRFAGSRRTSTRTCFPLGAVLTTPSNLASPLGSHRRALAIADGGSSEHARARCWCWSSGAVTRFRPCRTLANPGIHRSATAFLRQSGSRQEPLRLLSNLDVWERPCQAPAFVVVQESAP
jgi:hypothetical protein